VRQELLLLALALIGELSQLSWQVLRYIAARVQLRQPAMTAASSSSSRGLASLWDSRQSELVAAVLQGMQAQQRLRVAAAQAALGLAPA
jgi:hypothetical protein